MNAADRPLVTVHYAQTLDGRIATRTGQSQWISCNATLELAHRLRAEHQAVMVGVGTVLADNPRLTVRMVPGSSPLRIVCDSTLRLPLEAHVLTDGAARTILATTPRAPSERCRAVSGLGAEVIIVSQDTQGLVDMPELLLRLVKLGISSVLIEGGSRLVTSALRRRLIDRLVVCIAPKIMGAGVEAVGNLDILRVDDALQFSHAGFTAVGQDVVFDGQLACEPVSHV
ncbi:MAG: RibD family protein [Chloroflexota bacterium]|nr:MAG: 5-amino-6-(5-phosphoribosylamino)uracil reductase [Chloroflexota bacterium]